MDKLANFVERFIISEIIENGFFYLSDDFLFMNDAVDELVENISINGPKNIKILVGKKSSGRISTINSMIDSIKRDRSFDNDISGKEDVIALLQYQIFLDENGFDNRFKKQVRNLILSYIKKNNKQIKILREKYLFDDDKIEIQFIESASDFVKFKSSNFSKLDNVYYRGHSNLNWKTIPSIYRNSWYKNEHKMFREIIIRNSEEFLNTKSTFEKLTIMQHYGLPTRLLDITKNPLVALYFSCCDKNEVSVPGEVIVFVPDEKEIKYFDSDTVSILANLSKCERTLETTKTKKVFNNSYDQGLKLLHLIKEEKPYFLNIINPSDFNKALVVRPINNNARIKKQFGYFFLFGIDGKIENPAQISSTFQRGTKKVRYFIDDADKNKILDDLEGLGFNDETLFPEIEYGTEYLKRKYQIFT